MLKWATVVGWPRKQLQMNAKVNQSGRRVRKLNNVGKLVNIVHHSHHDVTESKAVTCDELQMGMFFSFLLPVACVGGLTWACVSVSVFRLFFYGWWCKWNRVIQFAQSSSNRTHHVHQCFQACPPVWCYVEVFDRHSFDSQDPDSVQRRPPVFLRARSDWPWALHCYCRFPAQLWSNSFLSMFLSTLSLTPFAFITEDDIKKTKTEGKETLSDFVTLICFNLYFSSFLWCVFAWTEAKSFQRFRMNNTSSWVSYQEEALKYITWND